MARARDRDVQRRPSSILGVRVLAHTESAASAAGLPVLAPSQCPTKTLFLCRERDRPRFSEAEFRLRRDAYDTAKVQYSNFCRSGSLGSQMDVDSGRAAVDLEAAGAQSDGTDLGSSDGEIAPASDAVVAWS